MEIEDLREVVRDAARGDPDSAGVLFDYYYPRLYSYALARLRRPADAEDVAAEAFARVVRDLDRFQWKGGGFGAWIFRIASNLVIDRVRRLGREDVTEDVAAGTGANVNLDESAEAAYLHIETSEELGALLGRLTADQREVLLLRFIGGLETEEVARVMHKRPNAVRQLQFRALTALRRLMSEDAQ